MHILNIQSVNLKLGISVCGYSFESTEPQTRLWEMTTQAGMILKSVACSVQ